MRDLYVTRHELTYRGAPEIVAGACRVFLNVEFAVALVVILVAAVFLVGGLRPYYVVSGSMEPEMPIGSLAVVSTRAEPSSLDEGDIVAFTISGGNTVTHRVVDNDEAAGRITTKGDSNDVVDPSRVAYSSVVGEVVAHVPGLGTAVRAVTANVVVVVASVVALNAALLLVSWLARRCS